MQNLRGWGSETPVTQEAWDQIQTHYADIDLPAKNLKSLALIVAAQGQSINTLLSLCAHLERKIQELEGTAGDTD